MRWRTGSSIALGRAIAGRLLASLDISLPERWLSGALAFRVGSFGKSAALTSLALCMTSTGAAAATHVFTCNGVAKANGALCKAGTFASCSGLGEDTDFVRATSVTSGAIITFTYTITSNLPPQFVTGVVAQGNGGNTGNPLPFGFSGPNGATGSSSYTVSLSDAADTQSDFSVSIFNNPPDAGVLTATYEVTCTPPGQGPNLIVDKSHTGDATQGQTGFQYTLSVSNVGGSATSGTVTVTETPPLGMTVTSLSGSGWSCNLSTCTRSDALAAGNSYPDITVTVDVASDAPASVTNVASVSGGNDSVTSDNTDEDPTTVVAPGTVPDQPMEEETKRFINRRVDNLLTYGPDRSRLLRRLQLGPSDANDASLALAGEPPPDAAARGVSNFARLSFGGPLGDDHGLPAEEDAAWRRGPPYPGAQVGAFGVPSAPTSTSSMLLSSIAGRLVPLAHGQTSFSFATSLSEIRAKAAEAEARAQQRKLHDAGLSYAGQSYPRSSAGLRTGFDIWVEGHLSRYSDDVGGIKRDGDFGILYVGADYVVAPGVLIGALAQVDRTDEDIADPARTGEIEGTGWMAGPYMGVKLLDGLFFDARAAWGRSQNDIWLNDAAGLRTGSFDTDRWLATATLTGVHYRSHWRISPQLGLAYGRESYGSYLNSIGQVVAGGEASIGRLTGGTEIGYRMRVPGGIIIEPMLGITGIWNFDSDDLVINGVLQDSSESRAKVDGGVLFSAPQGWGVRAAGNYDGIGSDDFESYGGSLWLNVPLN